MNAERKYPVRKFKYLLLFSLCFLAFACKKSGTDWKSPETVYSHLCSCKNKAGKTIDEQWVAVLNNNGILNRSPDELIRGINEHPELLYDMLDNQFIPDKQYRSNLKGVIDTLIAHGVPETPDLKGNFNDLFAIRSKYPACVMGIAYVRRSM